MRIRDWSSDVCASDLDRLTYADGPREIGPLKRVWIGCVEARDALNGCFKRIEASLLYQCGKLRAKAARSGCLMYDHAPAGFPHRNLDGFDVERKECAQVDNLRIYVQIGYGAGNHMTHGAIAKNGDRKDGGQGKSVAGS